jgi:probable HAF family extracellular repeat protein
MALPRLASAVVIALVLLTSLTHAQNASCTFDTFSAPSGYTLSEVQGVSDDGTVVGQLINNKTLAIVGFMRSSGGVFTEYAAPSSSSTWMFGRNGSGTNAGYYQDAKNPEYIHGFTLQAGKLAVVNYPKANNTWLFDVNLLGAAVGSFSASPSLTKGFMLLNGNWTTIAYPGAQATYAMAINDNGAVVGSYATTLDNGFLWQNGKFTTINHPLGKYGTVLNGINNSGVIVGNRLNGDRDFAFLYENGGFKYIVYPTGDYTLVGGINNNGLISGQIYLKGTATLGYTATCQ